MTDLLVNLPPIHPGEILLEEFLKPGNITQSQLAKDLGISFRRVNEVINAKRAITAETSLMLGRYFGLDDGFFLRLQADYDLRRARKAIAADLQRITPIKESA